MIEILRKYWREASLIGTFIGILFYGFNLIRDVQELKANQVSQETIRKIVNEEIQKANKALELELIKNYLLNR